MKKQLAIITTTALLGLTLNSSLVFADITNTTNSAQSNAAVSNTIDPSQSASTSTDSTVAPTSSSTSTGTNTAATAATTADNSTETTTGNATGTTASSLQLPPVQNSNGQTVTAGTLPDSPLYWLTNLIQKIELALTFNPAQKASVVQQQALQNLAAAEAMEQNGKTNLAQKALTDYSNKISQAEAFLTQVNKPNSDTAQALETGLAQTSAKNIAVLSELLDKLPPQAAQKVALNIVRSLEKDVNQAKSNQDPSNKANDKEKTALSKFVKMYGITNTASTDTNSENNDSTDNTTTSNDNTTEATETTSSANQAVSESTSSNMPSSTVEQNNSPIARAREKGQQGTAMSEEHSANKTAPLPHHS